VEPVLSRDDLAQGDLAHALHPPVPGTQITLPVPSSPDGATTNPPSSGNELLLDASELVHELRTPLHAARLALELIDGDGGAVAVLRSALTHLHDLLVLVTQEGQQDQPGSARAVAAEAILLADPGHRVRIIDTLDADLVVSSAATLRQLLVILVSNALKFSPPHSGVHVELRQTGEMVTIRVKDHGPGIDPGEWGELFRKGWRGGTLNAVPGSGLGLGIAHRLASRAGGHVTIKTSGHDGSTFELALPVVDF
jgi:two-component system sensor histidine kinase MprB